MPRVNVQGVGVVNFPDDMTEQQIADAIESELQKQPSRQSAAQAEQPSGNFGSPAFGVGAGLAQKAGSILYGAGELASKIPGVSRLAEAFGADPEYARFEAAPPDALDPKGLAQNVGYLAGGIAAAAVPVGKVGAVAKAANMGRLARGAALAGTDAGVAAVETGGDVDAIKQAGLTGIALEVAAPGAGKAIGATSSALKKWAVSQYAKALHPSSLAEKAIAKELAPQLMDRGVYAMTKDQLEAKAVDRLDGLRAALDTAWNQVPQGTGKSLRGLWNDIDSVIKDRYQIAGKPIDRLAGQATKELTDLKKDLRDFATIIQGGNKKVTAFVEWDRLRKARQWFDEIVSEAGGFNPEVANSVADRTALGARRTVGNIIRKHINADLPDIGALNEEIHIFKGVADLLEKATTRDLKQNAMAGGVGAVYGLTTGSGDGWSRTKRAIGYAAITGGLRGLVTSTGWRMVSAHAKNNLADAIANTDPDAIRGAMHAASVELARWRSEQREQSIMDSAMTK